MTRRTINIDDEALEGAKAWMGTKSITETVNEALRDMAKKPGRLAEIQNWFNDPYRSLQDIDEMEKAWQKEKYSLSTRVHWPEEGSD